jgi:2-amino-4-hydroxy-6-hydroxymethyldihydropteridine diphosphokinase
VRLDTLLSAPALLAALLQIEQSAGRIRRRHWGERTLDLDILLYGAEVIDQPDLQVPHPRLSERAFVLKPLLEIAGNLVLPNGRSLKSCCVLVKDQPICIHYDDRWKPGP